MSFTAAGSAIAGNKDLLLGDKTIAKLYPVG